MNQSKWDFRSYSIPEEKIPHLEIWIEYFCKIMALNAEKIYEQAIEASRKDANNVIKGLNKKI